MRASLIPLGGGHAWARAAVLILVLSSPVLQRAAWAFGFAEVSQRAKELAATPYKPPASPPRALERLDYDAYQQIRFKSESALWAQEGTAFAVSFFHPGRQFSQAVKINVVSSQGVRPVSFDPGNFNYGSNRFAPEDLAELGYAGFRILYPVNDPGRKDELLSFLGASYFRAVAPGQVYGLSARGLSVDTALASGEEFPRFTEFWIARPARSDRTITIYALLDSPRLTGAYRFVVTPGERTVQDVRLRLFLRDPVGRLGIAPLTSMFFFGENQRGPGGDYRPEVHDSDGLSVRLADGEWLWRPLVNPRRLLITSFAATDPAGFGLVQRDTLFASYQDPDASYQRRPSAWVEPVGRWGAGRIELVQIPTPDETNNNIVAYWVPDVAPPPGEPYELEYRLVWTTPAAVLPPLAHVVQTRRGRGYPPGGDEDVWLRVDFAGPVLDALPPDARVKAAVSADAGGELIGMRLQRNAAVGGWRMTLQLRRRDPAAAIELRAQLLAEDEAQGAHPLSETWSYVLPPD